MFRDLIDEWDPYHPVMLFLLIFPILLAHTEVRIYLFSTKVLFKMKTLSPVTNQCSFPKPQLENEPFILLFITRPTETVK